MPIDSWAGFIIANTLLDPVKPLILETTKAAIPIIGTAAQNFLNYTAKIIMALRDSLGK